jgi:GWxTD domain-containing protein
MLILFQASFILPVSAQTKDTLSTYYYRLGIAAFSNDNLEEAKELFKQSVNEEDNAPAEYELAKIYKADTSHAMWNISREHIKNAIKLDPANVSYRLYYASLALELSKMHRATELKSEDDALEQYKKVLDLDSTNSSALAGIGRVKANEFLEFNHSQEKFPDPVGFHDAIKNVQRILRYQNLGETKAGQEYELQNIASAKLDNYALDDFKSAENALLKSIRYDSLNPKPYFTLAEIYEDHEQSEKGIEPLVRLTRLLPDNKDAHLQLGLLYYRSGDPDMAYKEFSKAIMLMNNSDRKDFTINSTKVLIGPFLKNDFSGIDESYYYQIIQDFWKARDPLYLTKYNERLLEHYCRVAYANLRFSLPGYNIAGWKTDRGITVIRYGIPPARIRIRPDIHKPKTDVWIYKDKTFSFTDSFMNGVFNYAKAANTQYFGDSQDYASDLLADQKESYDPVFNGPRFYLPYKSLQFKDLKRNNLTDIYAGYAMPVGKEKPGVDNFNLSLKVGIYFLDKDFNLLSDNEKILDSLPLQNKIEIPDSGKFVVGSIEMKSPPDSGNFSFEIIRNRDKGVATYHKSYKLRNFNTDSLQLSDIVLASKIDRGLEIPERIKRRDYSILPNPSGIFSAKQNLYIYYEIYNLEKNAAGLTDFSQDLILQKRDENGTINKIFSPILKFVGINNEEKKTELSSNFQTRENNSQIDLQLDMTGYEPGDYVLTIKLKDNITGKETEQSTELTWK